MLKPDGQLEITGPGPGARTRDVIVCGHCQQAIPVRPGLAVVRTEAGPEVHWCGACGAFVCGPCKALAAKQGRCLNFTAQVDRQMEAQARDRQLSAAIGGR
jgi:hypothetical protein